MGQLHRGKQLYSILFGLQFGALLVLVRVPPRDFRLPLSKGLLFRLESQHLFFKVLFWHARALTGLAIIPGR
jgi:hypothetical protein